MSIRRNEVSEAPVRILSDATRQLLATRLDSRKILLTPQGIHRDWRGIAEQARLDVSSISSGKISPTVHCIHIWGKKLGTIGQLWSFLEIMDRFDIIDDSLSFIYSDYDKSMSQVGGLMSAVPPPIDDVALTDPDIITTDDMNNLRLGLGLQHYDALVLSADEDSDFVQELVEKLEGEYGLKLCLKDRDLLGGLQFETESIVRLIIERCSRVIVVLSPDFLSSNVNKFFTNFAHALSIDQRRRIVIPCQLKPCEKPAVISFCHSLEYYRAKGYWNYWEKLRNSLVPAYQPKAIQSLQSTGIEARDRIQELPSSPTLSLSPVTPSLPSPSQSPSFFSKMFRKAKLGSSGDSSSQQTSKWHVPVAEGTCEDLEDDGSSSMNGHESSTAIPIQGTSRSQTTSISSASLESSDFANLAGCLPDVPETPPLSPMTTTSSAALLLPEESSSSGRSQSKLLGRIFKGKKKRKDYG